jgi:TfoX-like protein
MAYDEELAGQLREVAAGIPGLSESRMFGGLAFLVNGHMAVAASGQGGLLLRVPPERTEELLGEAGANEFVMQDRAMTGWLRVEPSALTSYESVERWAAIGLDHAASLPPKAPKRT